jgi:hypothetical protein
MLKVPALGIKRISLPGVHFFEDYDLKEEVVHLHPHPGPFL